MWSFSCGPSRALLGGEERGERRGERREEKGEEKTNSGNTHDCPLGHPGTARLKSTSREENARHWRCCGLGRPPGASVATGDPLWVALGRVGARIGALQRDQGAHPPRLMVVIPSPKPLLTGPTRRVSSCFCDGWRPRTCGLRVDQPWDASARDGARTAARNARGARRRAAF